MSTFATVLILPWLLALLITPVVIRLASSRGYLDYPTARKAHQYPVAMLGGVAVFVSAALGLTLVMLWSESLRQGVGSWFSLLGLGAGTAAMVGLGLYDDFRDMRPLTKLGFQLAIAVATWLMGFRIGYLELPFGWMIVGATVPSLILTVCWIVLLTNAFNLIDGLDGLTTGVAIISGLTMYWLATDAQAALPLLGALALTGALCGFLRFNLPPARIFLGDAGALAIGYAIAVFSMASFQKSPTAMVIAVPLLAAGVAMLDTVLTILRRTYWHLREQGTTGLRLGELTRAVFRADRGHIHFLLQRLGWSPRRVLFSLYVTSGALATVALLTREAHSNVRWGILLFVVVAGLIGQRWLEAHVARIEQSAPEGASESMERDVDVSDGPASRSA
jgi:UDP-GlcNAc:undecaprenyl-phosphate GlcNAc-1-phosphate transferase